MKNLLMIICIAFSLSLQAQNTWEQQDSCPFKGRYSATTFTINGKGYIMGGTDNRNYLKDLWQYDTVTGWTRKADYPNTHTNSAVAFVIGGKAYVGMGDRKNELWEYDPELNVWNTKSKMPNGGRFFGAAFSFNEKGYIACGIDSTEMANGEVWEYDPIFNTWSMHGGLPDTKTPVVFTINNKAYIGLIEKINGGMNHLKSFNLFVRDSDLITLSLPDQGEFSTLEWSAFVGGYGFIGYMGISGYSINDVWQYSPDINEWKRQTPFSGRQRLYTSSFTAGNSCYIFNGLTFGDSVLSDLWQYTPDIRLGIDNQNAVNPITIYPNPVHGVLNIESNESLTTEIYSLVGEKMIESSRTKIDLSELNPGIYLVKYKSANSAGFKRIVVD